MHRVQNAARVGVDQKHVGEAIFLKDAAEQRVKDGMDLGVDGLIASGVEQQLGADGMLVLADVEVLEVRG